MDNTIGALSGAALTVGGVAAFGSGLKARSVVADLEVRASSSRYEANHFSTTADGPTRSVPDDWRTNSYAADGALQDARTRMNARFAVAGAATLIGVATLAIGVDGLLS